MALKDLIAQKAKLTEEAIEAIISDYVRYDIEEQEIVLTPEATTISSKAKILVFLVAQQGWQFVVDEATDLELSPSDLEHFLGIKGGTLRPILKDLKDRNLLAAKSGKYSVRSTSLNAIKGELDGRSTLTPRKQRKPRKRQSKLADDSQSNAEAVSVRTKASAKRTKSSAQSGQKPGEAFTTIIGEGFFDTGRTLAQLQTRLHERAIIIRQTSLPSYLLKAVRSGQLTREKQNVDGKEVWVYTSTK